MQNCKHCFDGCQKVKDNNETIWKCANTGIWNYQFLPSGLRIAILTDIKEKGERILKKDYLLYSSFKENYQAYTISINTDMEMLELFVERKKCWVKITL